MTRSPTTRRSRSILLYADSERDADMLFASGFHAPDPFIFVRTATGRRHVVMSDLEIDRARDTSNAHRVHSLTDYLDRARRTYGRSSGVPEVIALVLRDLRIRSVDVPNRFPLGVAAALQKRGVGVRPRPDPFFPERMRKNRSEVNAIKEALRTAERGIRAAFETLAAARIRSGFLIRGGRRLTSEALRAIIDTTVLSHGFMPAGTIVAGGRQGADPHERGRGPLRANVPIIIDVFPRSTSTGFYGDITRTVVRGRATERVRAMYAAVHDAQRSALRMVRSGVRAREVHAAACRCFTEHGFTTGARNGYMQGFIHATGHGLGLEIHEPPRIAGGTNVLRKGMVVTIEPGLYYRRDGGVRIEDTVLVTEDGAKNLTRIPKFLEI